MPHRTLFATATAALLALASPAFAILGSGQDTVNGTGRGSGENIGSGSDAWDEWCGGCGRPMPRSIGLPNLSEGGAPFYGYNPNLLAVGDRAIGRARAATFRTNRGEIPGFIVNGDFYAVHGTLVVHGVAPRARPGGRTEAVMRPGGRHTPDSRPTPNPDRPSLSNRGNRDNRSRPRDSRGGRSGWSRGREG